METTSVLSFREIFRKTGNESKLTSRQGAGVQRGKNEHSIRNQVIAGIIVVLLVGAGAYYFVRVSNTANTTNGGTSLGGSNLQNNIAGGQATFTSTITQLIPTTVIVTTTSVSTSTQTTIVTTTMTTIAPPPANVTVIGKVSTLGAGTHATGITFQTANGYTNSPGINSTGFYYVILPNQRTYTVSISGAYTVSGTSSGTCQVPSSFVLDVGAGTQDLRMDWAC